MEYTNPTVSGLGAGPPPFQCAGCQKQYPSARQRDRHTLRCKHRNRSRKRACLPCSKAKARCDQQTPACNRCVLKSLSCVYGQDVQSVLDPVVDANAPVPEPAPELNWPTPEEQTEPVASFGGVEPTAAQLGITLNGSGWPMPLEVTDEEILAILLGTPQGLEDSEKPIRPHLIHTKIDTSNTGPSSSSSPATILSVSTGPDAPEHNNIAWLPASQIRLIKQVFKGYVKDVSSADKRHTFMHHVSLGSSTVPAPLANAILVAKMYVSKTPASGAFVRDMVKMQYAKILAECEEYGDQESLTAVQAIVLYTIMYMFDGDSDDVITADETFSNLVLKLAPKVWNSCNVCTGTLPATWTDWITLETKRRTLLVLHNLDYLIHAQLARPNIMCPVLLQLPLPCSHSIWNAQTEESWRVELERDPRKGVLLQLADLLAWGEGKRDEKTAHVENWMQNMDKFGMAICSCTMVAMQ